MTEILSFYAFMRFLDLLLSLVYFVKNNLIKRSNQKICRKCAMLGDYFRYPKTGGGGGGCELQIKVARDRDILQFEHCVNNI